ERLGMAEARSGGTPPDDISAIARKIIQDKYGYTVDRLPDASLPSGPAHDTWIVRKGDRSQILVFNEDGTFEVIPLDGVDAGSIENAARQLAAAREALEPVERLGNLIGGAMLLLFVYDAVEKMRDLARHSTACRILREYIDLIKDGKWGLISSQLQKWES